MSNYEIPRNYKGEGRILNIFSYKAIIYTTAGAGIGLIFYFLLKMFNAPTMIGILIILFLGLIGFVIGTFKIPESNAIEFTKNVGGENIDDVIIRLIKFRSRKSIYVYKDEGETKDGQQSNN